MWIKLIQQYFEGLGMTNKMFSVNRNKIIKMQKNDWMKYFFLIQLQKMYKEFVKFGDIESGKTKISLLQKFNQHK